MLQECKVHVVSCFLFFSGWTRQKPISHSPLARHLYTGVSDDRPAGSSHYLWLKNDPSMLFISFLRSFLDYLFMMSMLLLRRTKMGDTKFKGLTQ